jgi:MFS family permease
MRAILFGINDRILLLPLLAMVALGAGEAASFPAGARVIRDWAPTSERGRAAAFLNVGGYAGPAFGSVLLGRLVASYGWRTSFYVTGAIGLGFAALWYACYRHPEEASRLRPAERTRILAERPAPS